MRRYDNPLSRKIYKDVAEILNNYYRQSRGREKDVTIDIVQLLAVYFAEDNPMFDADRFMHAIIK